jgi:Rps23 Pro-64 3,4-dihydroxylase Tpa1-like proline 4-hydroxylase
MEFIQNKHFSNQQIQSYREEYQRSKPYHHVMIDNFLSEEIARKLSQSFPKDELFNHPKKDIHENKLEGDRFDLYPDIFSALKTEIAKPQFSAFIEAITGIKGTFITDDVYGVGIQKGKKGSFEDVHIDFNIHPEKDVQHRLNFQLFLSPSWKAEWNGALEMWNDCVSKCKKAVSCRFNRAIIFEVKDTAYYGYTKPLECPDNADRKLFSANFYTVKEEQGIAYHDTIFPNLKDARVKSSIFSSIKKALKVS